MTYTFTHLGYIPKSGTAKPYSRWCLILLDTATQFSKGIVPFYTHTNYIWILQLLHILPQSDIVSVKFSHFWLVCSEISLWFWFLIVLMTSDVEYLFVCWSAIHLGFVVNSCLRFCPFKKIEFVFLLLIYKSSLTRIFYYKYFHQCLTCHFILFMIIFDE